MSSDRVQADNFDPNIVPAETAARIEREQESYKQVPKQSEGDIDTSSGYTVDQEGLVNNYAIEPEMYINEPGDLREAEAEAQAARAEELKEINQTDEDGNLTPSVDQRGKGVGVI
jgi:hypothetical protein